MNGVCLRMRPPASSHTFSRYFLDQAWNRTACRFKNNSMYLNKANCFLARHLLSRLERNLTDGADLRPATTAATPGMIRPESEGAEGGPAERLTACRAMRGPASADWLARIMHEASSWVIGNALNRAALQTRAVAATRARRSTGAASRGEVSEGAPKAYS